MAKGHASRAGPTQALKETLEALCADEKNVSHTETLHCVLNDLQCLICLLHLCIIFFTPSPFLFLPPSLSHSLCTSLPFLPFPPSISPSLSPFLFSFSVSLSFPVYLQVVFVVSGKELYAVSEFFGDVRGLGLGAEHGFYYRWPALRDESSQGVATDSGKTTPST